MISEDEATVGQDSYLESEWSNQGADESGDDSSADEHLEQNRTILWLCQEGQIHLARKRFDSLLSTGDNATASKHKKLRKEVFQVGRDKNFPIHEILMGGTSDRNAYAMTLAILDFAKKFPLERQRMLSTAPPSHGRTALHWAAWGNAKLEILDGLVRGNPESLLVKDKKSQGERRPLEILKRYFSNRNSSTTMDPRVAFLERMTASWVSHRVRLSVHLCANRYFGPGDRTDSPLIPFKKSHRQYAGIKPKPWFLLSVIGYLLQREMKPLALRIISFLGGNAKVEPKKRRQTVSSKKRKR